MSGELDVSTPPQTARDEALPFLDHGTQVTVPHASHVDDLWGLQPDAMQHLVTAFLNSETLDARFDANMPALSLPARLPAVAKTAAGAIASTVFAVAAAGALRLRR